MNREKKLESILVITAGFIVLFLVFKLMWILVITLAIVALSAMSDLFLNGITWVWFKISFVLGWINTRILLVIVFYVYLYPITLIRKLFCKDELQLKKNNSGYIVRNHTYKPEDIENVW